MRLANRTLTVRILPVIVAAACIGGIWALTPAMSSQLLNLTITAAIFTISILGLGVVTGSAGMIALCQLSFAAVGAWVVSGLNFWHLGGDPNGDPAGSLTVLGWLVLGGAAAGTAGILIGLPALRLRGVNLAVVTLGFAAALNYALVQIQFPGVDRGMTVPRPTPPFDDELFLVFCVAVLAICALCVYFMQRGRWGASWKSVAFSERGTASVGASVSASKLTAFAVSATLGGIGGGLLVMKTGETLASEYVPLSSLALYVLAIIAGAHFIDMAIFGGILWVAVPALLQQFDIPKDWAFVIFGALSVQALTSGATLGGVIRDAWWKRVMRRRARAQTGAGRVELEPAEAEADTGAENAPSKDAADLLVVDDLTVEFGAVRALNGMSLMVREGSIMGLIGPNGAGKSTFVDAISGFLTGCGGSVTLAGESLRRLSPTQRARHGLRRTFQQDRVPPSLTIEAYLRFVVGHRISLEEIEQTLEFFGCPQAQTRLAGVDVGTRRVIEVAANALARPRVLLLDEPAAGLSHEEHLALGQRIRQLPARFGVAVVLIEHDLDLVRSVCDEITVLDFGKVIASGHHEEVLADPAVMTAYMGETEATS